MNLTRKQFLRSMAGVVVGAAGAALLVGCASDDDGDDPPPGGNCLADGTSVQIGSNHSHSMSVTKDEVNLAVEKVYEIKGASPHPHSVTVTAAMFAMLKTNTSITATSTPGGTDNHTHVITINCV